MNCSYFSFSLFLLNSFVCFFFFLLLLACNKQKNIFHSRLVWFGFCLLFHDNIIHRKRKVFHSQILAVTNFGLWICNCISVFAICLLPFIWNEVAAIISCIPSFLLRTNKAKKKKKKKTEKKSENRLFFRTKQRILDKCDCYLYFTGKNSSTLHSFHHFDNGKCEFNVQTKKNETLKRDFSFYIETYYILQSFFFGALPYSSLVLHERFEYGRSRWHNCIPKF